MLIITNNIDKLLLLHKIIQNRQTIYLKILKKKYQIFHLTQNLIIDSHFMKIIINDF